MDRREFLETLGSIGIGLALGDWTKLDAEEPFTYWNGERTVIADTQVTLQRLQGVANEIAFTAKIGTGARFDPGFFLRDLRRTFDIDPANTSKKGWITENEYIVNPKYVPDKDVLGIFERFLTRYDKEMDKIKENALNHKFQISTSDRRTVIMEKYDEEYSKWRDSPERTKHSNG